MIKDKAFATACSVCGSAPYSRHNVLKHKEFRETQKAKGDTTTKRRQSRRRERLNEIAKASGFASWSVYETACLNGVAKPNNSVQPTIESGRVLPAKKSNRKGSAPAISG